MYNSINLLGYGSVKTIPNNIPTDFHVFFSSFSAPKIQRNVLVFILSMTSQNSLKHWLGTVTHFCDRSPKPYDVTFLLQLQQEWLIKSIIKCGWNNLCIPRKETLSRWSLGMNKEYHITLPWITVNPVKKRGLRSQRINLYQHCHQMRCRDMSMESMVIQYWFR